MQHVRLTNDSYVLKTSQGLVTLTRKSFNFNKIAKLIQENAEEKDILPLLEPPENMTSLYEAYLYKEVDKIFYIRVNEASTEIIDLSSGEEVYVPRTEDTTFLGVYASIHGILEDWPEYAL